MDPREQKARLLARSGKLKTEDQIIWSVPSQTSTRWYKVDLRYWSCTCQDYVLNRTVCKHQLAVRFAMGGTHIAPGEEVPRPTYPQCWATYNLAQCQERETVPQLLYALCQTVETPPHTGRGPKPIPLADVICAMGMQVFSGTSARRATSDLKRCEQDGFLSRRPHYNSVLDHFGDPELTPILQRLVKAAALPMSTLDTVFAVDSTGLGAQTYERWYNHRYERQSRRRDYIKVHIMCSVKHHFVAAVTVTDGDSSDSKQLYHLLMDANRGFFLNEVLADMAYPSVENVMYVENLGATPYFALKENTSNGGHPGWRRLYHRYHDDRPEFLAHYHQRSNVEAVFSALKRKLGETLRSRKHEAQVNEALVKVLLYNLGILARLMIEQPGVVQPTFWPAMSA